MTSQPTAPQPDHSPAAAPAVMAQAEQRWKCACGWYGTPSQMTVSNTLRTCPQCGASGGLIIDDAPAQPAGEVYVDYETDKDTGEVFVVAQPVVGDEPPELLPCPFANEDEQCRIEKTSMPIMVRCFSHTAWLFPDRWNKRRPAGEQPPDDDLPSHCNGCGRMYRVDVQIDNDLWERIAYPDYPKKLCGVCIVERVEQLNKHRGLNLIDNARVRTPSDRPAGVHPFGPCGYKHCDWPDGELRCNEPRLAAVPAQMNQLVEGE